MLDLDVTSNINEAAIKPLKGMRRQMRVAIAQAMGFSARKAQNALRAQTPRYVDKPTKFTLNSTFVKVKVGGANREVKATVGFKLFAFKGTPAGEYLQPMAAGGERRAKRSELRLRQSGLIEPNQFIVPTDVFPLRLNPSGNLPGSKYVQVLSRLKAFNMAGFLANVSKSKRSQSKRAQRDFFLGEPGGLPLGIQARVGPRPIGKGGVGSKKGGRPATSKLPRGFHTVFYVTSSPKYEQTFPIKTILEKTFANTFDKSLRASLAKLMASAG